MFCSFRHACPSLRCWVASEQDNETKSLMWKLFFLEKGDVILHKHQRSIVFKHKCWWCLPSSSPAPPYPCSLSCPYSLLPSLPSSFWQNNIDIENCFVFTVWGKPLSQVRMVLHIVQFLELMALASYLCQMECLSRKVLLGAGKGPQSACSRSPSELMAATQGFCLQLLVFFFLFCRGFTLF